MSLSLSKELTYFSIRKTNYLTPSMDRLQLTENIDRLKFVLENQFNPIPLQAWVNDIRYLIKLILIPEGIIANGFIWCLQYQDNNSRNGLGCKYYFRFKNNHVTLEDGSKIYWEFDAEEETLCQIKNTKHRCYVCAHSTDPDWICIQCEQLICSNHMVSRSATNTVEACICWDCYESARNE